MTIPDHFTIMYDKTFTSAVQQVSSRYKKAAIITTGITGEAKTHNMVLPVDDYETTGQRGGKTILQELQTDKRWNTPLEFKLATQDVEFDEVLLAPTIMPGGKHIEQHQAAYARRMDKVFIQGALGTNYVGKTGVVAEEIPASQIVPVDFVLNGVQTVSSLNIDKIVRSKTLLRKNDAYSDDRISMGTTLWGAMTPNMEEYLLMLANGTNSPAGNRLFSRDFMPPVLDANGNISFFLGVNWIRSNELPVDPVDPTIQYAAIWTSDAIHLDIWKDISTRVDVRPDLNYITQFYSKYAFNACRSEVKKVIKIATKIL